MRDLKRNLVIGTRSSKLALWQAEHIRDTLQKHYPDLKIDLLKITTKGDKILDVPLAKIGGKGLFTKEIENALLSKEVDLAVHSLKDMPTDLPEGLEISAISKREEPYDALISPKFKTLDNLPHGAKVGTSSLRRKAQILKARSDLVTVDLRGNLDSRLRKLETENLDAIILASSGLKRLGWQEHITEILSPEVCLPAVGQGALAIESRKNDTEVLEIIKVLNDESSFIETTAERSFLAEVEGSCQVPVGVYAKLTPDKKELVLKAIILSPDGNEFVQTEVRGLPNEKKQLGIKAAHELLNSGGKEILKKIGLFCNN
ncbi:hydroxymethylbilane synthase [Selenomonadales bacterium OttesenSCG-928-I06]|nr:hydroxymethylbilane synthase [Selenomonadales bacterium OttesenSCG-928-I06]